MTTKVPQQMDATARPLLDAEDGARLARERREKKAAILEEARAAVAKLREERGAALRADDGPRIKKLTTALGEAREVLDLAEQDHEIAAKDERAAGELFERLTREDKDRRRQEHVAGLLAEHAKLKELQDRACDEVARTVREMNRVEKELEGIGEKDKASALHGSRPRHTFDVSRALAEAARLARPVAESSPAATDAP